MRTPGARKEKGSRCAILALALLAGCMGIADPASIRSPRTEAEWAEFHRLAIPVGRVRAKLEAANLDLCADVWGCQFIAAIGFANGIGGFYRAHTSPPEVHITVPLLRLLRSDDEIALIMAHELSHIRLDHDKKYNNIGPMIAETQAECVGTLLMMRAGFNPETGVAIHRRLASSPSEMMFSLVGGTYKGPGFAERVRIVESAAHRARGHPLTRETIRSICGISP